MKCAFIAALLLAWSTTGLAAKWVELPMQSSDIRLSVDAESAQHSGDVHTAWVRRDYGPKGYREVGINGVVSYTLTKWYINCSLRRVATGEGVAYAASGEVLHRSPGTPTDYRDVPPSSVGDAFIGAWCRN